jgi:ABC-type tungstate transport system substrate-binding protein
MSMEKEQKKLSVWSTLESSPGISNAGAYEVIVSLIIDIINYVITRYLPVEDSFVLHIDNFFCSFAIDILANNLCKSFKVVIILIILHLLLTALSPCGCEVDFY